MAASRFDRVTKDLVTATTRRKTLAGRAGGLIATLAAVNS